MIRRLVARGVAPKTIVDVGANIGQFAFACAHAFPSAKIYAFEPIPESAAKLRSRIASQNVALREVAIGEEDGEKCIFVNSDDRASSILSVGRRHSEAFPHATESRKVVVPVRKLDTELGDADLARSVLLKLDVQGYERFAIAGAAKVLAMCEYVLIEASFEPMYEGEWSFSEMFDEMRRLRFNLSCPLDFLSSNTSDQIVQADLLFQRDTRSVAP